MECMKWRLFVHMKILVFLIVLSLSFYVFYKIKQIRTKMPMEKRMRSGQSSMTLGLFVFLFGLNLLFLFSSIVSYIVAAIFILIGGANAIRGFKYYRYHLPYAIREAEEFNNESKEQ